VNNLGVVNVPGCFQNLIKSILDLVAVKSSRTLIQSFEIALHEFQDNINSCDAAWGNDPTA